MPSPSAPGTSCLNGGCLCQGVRFQIQPPAAEAVSAPQAVYCHCTACRRASGAAMAAWLLTPAPTFHYTQGYPRCFLSTPQVQREFCPQCGTALLIRPLRSPLIRVSLIALDTPHPLIPQAHIWTSARLPWVQIDDQLPHYAEEGPF